MQLRSSVIHEGEAHTRFVQILSCPGDEVIGLSNPHIRHDKVCEAQHVPGQQRMYEIDLETHTVSRSAWLFHPRSQPHCSVANERPKLHASIPSPCGPEPHASFHKLRLAICSNLEPLSDSSTEALDGLQNGSCVTMPGLSFTLTTLEQALAEELHMY